MYRCDNCDGIVEAKCISIQFQRYRHTNPSEPVTIVKTIHFTPERSSLPVMLVQFHLVAEDVWRWLKLMVSFLPRKLIDQFTSNLVCTLIGRVYRKFLILCRVGPIGDLWWPKITENGIFQPWYVELLTQSTSNLVCTLIAWIPIWVLWWPKNHRKLWFLAIMCISNHSVHLKILVCLPLSYLCLESSEKIILYIGPISVLWWPKYGWKLMTYVLRSQP